MYVLFLQNRKIHVNIPDITVLYAHILREEVVSHHNVIFNRGSGVTRNHRIHPGETERTERVIQENIESLPVIYSLQFHICITCHGLPTVLG